MFQRLHHIAYRCRDAQRTVEFYTQVVGLKYCAGLLPPAWLDDERITAGFALGGLLVLAGVYVGALRPPVSRPPPSLR